DKRLQAFGQLHQQSNAVLGARGTIEYDHWILCIGQEPRRFLDRTGIALWGRGRNVTWDGELLAVVADRLLLEAGIERDRDRPVGRRHCDLVGAYHRLGEMLQPDRGVVP